MSGTLSIWRFVAIKSALMYLQYTIQSAYSENWLHRARAEKYCSNNFGSTVSAKKKSLNDHRGSAKLTCGYHADINILFIILPLCK